MRKFGILGFAAVVVAAGIVVRAALADPLGKGWADDLQWHGALGIGA